MVADYGLGNQKRAFEMVTAFEQVREWFDWFSKRPMERRLCVRVPLERIRDDPQLTSIDGATFQPENSYYSVRIVELFLRNAGEYFRNFLPMAVTLSEYTRGGDTRALPFFINNDKLREAIGPAGSGLGLVQMQNVYAMRYVPTNADGLSLFCGLFRVAHQDFAAALLDMLAEVGGQIGGEVVGRGAEMGRTVYSRLSRIVGMQDVEFRFGQLDGAALAGGSGYRVFAGEADLAVSPNDLWMVNGRLHRKDAGGAVVPVTEFDYCVVALEHTASRAEIGMLTNLALHRQWNAVVPHLTAKRAAEAEAEFQKLQAEILLTPDLTEMDRLIALGTYQKRWVDISEHLAGAMTRRTLRGPTDAFRKSLMEAEDQRRKMGEVGVAEVVKQLRTRLRSGSEKETDAASTHAIDMEAVAMAKIFQHIDSQAGDSAGLAAVLTAARFLSNNAMRTRSLLAT
jgi:hypothetical protein